MDSCKIIININNSGIWDLIFETHDIMLFDLVMKDINNYCKHYLDYTQEHKTTPDFEEVSKQLFTYDCGNKIEHFSPVNLWLLFEQEKPVSYICVKEILPYTLSTINTIKNGFEMTRTRVYEHTI